MKFYRNEKIIHNFEGILQLFIGLGAVICGVLMIIQPDGSIIGLPLKMLYGSPFNNFLIPGILLFLVNGLGNVFSAILCFKQHALAGFSGILFGFGLIIWLFVQVNMIGGGHWLQYFYFILGVIELCCGILIREVVNEKQ